MGHFSIVLCRTSNIPGPPGYYGDQKGLEYSQNAPPCCAVHSRSVMSDSLWPRGLKSTRLLCPWGFSRQEYWGGLASPPRGDLPDPGIKPSSLMSPALASRFFTTSSTGGTDGMMTLRINPEAWRLSEISKGKWQRPALEWSLCLGVAGEREHGKDPS